MVPLSVRLRNVRTKLAKVDDRRRSLLRLRQGLTHGAALTGLAQEWNQGGPVQAAAPVS